MEEVNDIEIYVQDEEVKHDNAESDEHLSCINNETAATRNITNNNIQSNNEKQINWNKAIEYDGVKSFNGDDIIDHDDACIAEQATNVVTCKENFREEILSK